MYTVMNTVVRTAALISKKFARGKEKKGDKPMP